MNYYKLKEDNTIEQYTTIPDGEPVPSFIEDEFTPTSRNIIRLHDGTLAFEDETDMEAEAAAIAAQKAEQERLASLPTLDDRVENLEAENESMNDMILGLVEVIDNL